MTRIGRRPRTSEPDEASTPDPAGGDTVTRRSPGLAALFGTLHDDGRHSILDLGPARGRHLRLLGRFGHVVRFAGLVPRPSDEADWLQMLITLPANGQRPYDVVLLWDLLDRLTEGERPPVIARIAHVAAGSARLYAVVDASDSVTTRPLAFDLVDLDRVTQIPVGPPEPAGRQILPAQVERALDPFKVVSAFTLRGGLREYVAQKEER